MTDFEQSDILGGSQHPLVKPSSRWASSGVTFFTILSIVFGLYYVASFVHIRWSLLQEENVRKATRRRYGIPDSDNRPFAVAHAAVERVRKEREAEEEAARAGAQAHPAAARHKRSAFSEANHLRSTSPQPRYYSPNAMGPYGLPLAGTVPLNRTVFFPDPAVHQKVSGHSTLAAVYEHNIPLHDLQSSLATFPLPSSLETHKKRGPKVLDLGGHTNEARKHDRDRTDDDTSTSKKSRVEGRELIDGNEEPGWVGNDVYPSVKSQEQIAHPAPGLQETAYPDDDTSDESTGNDKRMRRLLMSPEYMESPTALAVDEGIDTDIQARGTKRDRRDEESIVGDDDAPHEGYAHRRKRRMSHKPDPSHTTAIHTRGRKRERDADLPNPDGDDLSHWRKTKRKLNRDATASNDSDVVMEDDDVDISEDPLCGGRRVGEIWESSGHTFKVGADRRRRRLELVKKSRPKFTMPMDSQHPDLEQSMEFYVEMWLTEEDYEKAKSQQQLAWQHEARQFDASAPSAALKEALPPAGKSLLWASPHKSTVRDRDLLTSPVATNFGNYGNPFQQKPVFGVPASRRVASATVVQSDGPKMMLPSRSERTGLRATRSFSKWEKQELEAKALEKLRRSALASRPLNAPPASTTSVSFTPTVTLPSTAGSLVPSSATMSHVLQPSTAPTSAESSVNRVPMTATLSLPSSHPPVVRGNADAGGTMPSFSTVGTTANASSTPTSMPDLSLKPASSTPSSITPALGFNSSKPALGFANTGYATSNTSTPTLAPPKLKVGEAGQGSSPVSDPLVSSSSGASSLLSRLIPQNPSATMSPPFAASSSNSEPATVGKKFSFGFAGNPTSSLSTSGPSASSSTSTGGEQSKFTFGIGRGPERTSEENSRTAQPTGGPEGPSTFVLSGTSSATSNPSMVAKSTPARGGAEASSLALQSTGARPAPIFSFGAHATPTPTFGASASTPFVGFGSKVTDASKATGVTLAGSEATGDSTFKVDTNRTPAFSFASGISPGPSVPTNRTAPGAAQSVFAFGGTPTPAFDFGGSTTPTGSPFGNAAKASSAAPNGSTTAGPSGAATSIPSSNFNFGSGGPSTMSPATSGLGGTGNVFGGGATGASPTVPKGAVFGQPSTPGTGFPRASSVTPTVFTFGRK